MSSQNIVQGETSPVSKNRTPINPTTDSRRRARINTRHLESLKHTIDEYGVYILEHIGKDNGLIQVFMDHFQSFQQVFDIPEDFDTHPNVFLQNIRVVYGQCFDGDQGLRLLSEFYCTCFAKIH